MTITLHCPKCKSGAKIGSKGCRKCGFKFTPSNRKYRVSVKLSNGKRRSKIVESLNLARKLEAKLKTESMENSVLSIQKSPHLQDIWMQYLCWAKTNKKSWKEDQGRWEYHVEPHLKNLFMDKVTPRNIEVILETMLSTDNRQRRPYAPQTVKHVLILIKRVFNWATRRELYHGQNPCMKVKPPKFDNRVNQTLNRKELNNLLSVLDSWRNQRAAMIVKFALYTGKRRGEILSLRWDDVDLENRLMTFHGTTTKSGKSQTLPINNKAYEVIQAAKALSVCDVVFSSKKGPYTRNGFYSIWRCIRKKAGINIRFHDLRHTYASYLASSGKVDIYTLKELLGHSDITMTQRYAHLINGALRKAACVADEVF